MKCRLDLPGGWSCWCCPRRSHRQTEARSPLCGRASALVRLCSALREEIGFAPSARGWLYLLEDRANLGKGSFPAAERLITGVPAARATCRSKSAPRTKRGSFDGVEQLDADEPDDHADDIVSYLRRAHHSYKPYSFWEDQEYYLQTLVEKIDLKTLFAGECQAFYIPRANSRGWSEPQPDR